MTTKWNPAKAARLIAEAKGAGDTMLARLIRTKHGTFGTHAVMVVLENSAALADQLEAALTENVTQRAVVTAAEQWRSAMCDRPNNCGDGYTYHDHDCPRNESMRSLIEAVDAYCSAQATAPR